MVYMSIIGKEKSQYLWLHGHHDSCVSEWFHSKLNPKKEIGLPKHNFFCDMNVG